MNDIIPDQRRILADWFGTIGERDEQFDFPIQFTRVLAGDKPATILQQRDWNAPESPFDSEEDVLAFIEDLRLFHRQQKKSRSHTVSNSSWRLDLLPTVARARAKEAMHKRLGVLYGYPREDIEWFSRRSERVSPRERVDDGSFTAEEMAFVDFLGYRCEDSIEGFERAVEEGQRIRSLVETVAESWRLPVLDRLAEDHYQLSVAVYSGEREHFPGEFTGFKMVCKNPALD